MRGENRNEKRIICGHTIEFFDYSPDAGTGGMVPSPAGADGRIGMRVEDTCMLQQAVILGKMKL